MLKNILKLSVIGFFIVSCSDADEQFDDLKTTDNAVIHNGDITDLELKISVDKTQGNIFEPFIFQLSQKNSNWYFGNLDEHLDSLVFKMAETQETRKIFEKKKGGNSGMSMFSHHFYFPGDYTASILGYKNGKIIYKDQISMKIEDNNDFLAVDWNNFSETQSQSYHNVFLTNRMIVESAFENNHPFVIVKNMWEYFMNYSADELSQKDKNYLYNYLFKYYSVPQYSETNTSDLKSVYLQNFKKTLYNDIPVNIWITAKNKIALMKEYSKTDPTQFYGYRIIAEPNN